MNILIFYLQKMERFSSVNRKEMRGVQLSTIYNISKQMRGVQISGLGNVAVTVRIAGAVADIHSGADAATVETVLRILKSC